MNNHAEITMRGVSVNESFARVAAAAFITPCDPSVGVMNDVKTAVSEAVTNAIIHGYEHGEGDIRMAFSLEDGLLTVTVSDDGAGIGDIERAREPMFTTKPEAERSGMGFTVMESFMDDVEVRSAKGEGTTVIMTKRLRS